MATFNIKFASIDTLSKFLADPPRIEIQPQEYEFNFIVDIKLSTELKAAIVITDVSILWKNNNSKVGQFKTGCLFEFPEFDDVFKKVNGDKYDIPVDLEILLKSTGISTTRGIISSELRGTYLHHAVLPLIDIPGIIISQRKSMLEENKEVK